MHEKSLGRSSRCSHSQSGHESRGGTGFGFTSWREVRAEELQGTGGSDGAVGSAGCWGPKGESASKRVVQSLFTGVSICGVSACSGFMSSCDLWAQSPGVSPDATYLLGWLCQELQAVSIWGGLSSLTCCLQLLSYVNKPLCSLMSVGSNYWLLYPFLMRGTYSRRESSNKFRGKLQQLKLILCLSCYHICCVI